MLSVLAGRAASYWEIILVLTVLSHYDLSLPGYETAVVSLRVTLVPETSWNSSFFWNAQFPGLGALAPWMVSHAGFWLCWCCHRMV